ncbi:hypothetical protein PMI23_04540 [Pseudomonas sp. GM24]|jgi:hypothetical protein|nr:hypothetical protein PMI19_04147 [Pseudomonas sp. GM16]EJM31076.1 hypothetical protein PMI23_04540 [Pseudomonas sp. GM24]
MKRATILQIERCRLKIIGEGRVPSPITVARELGAEFSRASIVLGLRQLESREVRRLHVYNPTQDLPPARTMVTDQGLKSRLSMTEKLVAELKARTAHLERREKTLNRNHTKAQRKLAKSRYRNRDYRLAMDTLSAEIVALELALKRAGERWRPEHLSVPDLASATLLHDNKARLIAQRYSILKQPAQNNGDSQRPSLMHLPQDALCSRLLTVLSLNEEHKHRMYRVVRTYADENKHLAGVIKELERKILIMEQNQRRCNGTFSHLWPEDLLKKL